MALKQKRLTFDFKFLNWHSLILVTIAILYGVQFATLVINGRVPVNYGDDYFAFWSVGRIADEKGYALIYDLNELKNVQINYLRDLGIRNINTDSFSPIPVPIFAVFVPALQLFSKLPLDQGYWTWTVLNTVLYFSYVLFYLRRNSVGSSGRSSIFVLAFVSFPFFVTISIGQINVFLTVFLGEFVRNGYEKRPFRSGLWLGGLLLKPQLLILVIPILLFLRYWKTFSGFTISAFVILFGSFLLTGIQGTQELIRLWFKYSEGLATNAVAYMVNWRMVGENLNTFLHTTWGWIITAAGIIATLIFVYKLVKKSPLYGSQAWGLMMLGVFSATTVITWHSHYHMALVLVPLLIFVTSHKLLNPRYFFIWVVVTPLLITSIMLLSITFPAIAKLGLMSYQGVINAFPGLALNLMLLKASLRIQTSCS